MFRPLTIAAAVCAGAVLAQAQTPAPGRADARKQERQAKRAQARYQRLEYAAAAPLYEADARLSREEMVRLANSYRLNHDTENAELWYGQVVAAGSPDPEDLLYYAQALQSNGRHEEARVYFERFDALPADAGDGRGAAFAKTVSGDGVAVTDVALRNERAVNSAYLDFSPAIVGEEVVFVSTRPVSRPGAERKDDWIDEPFMSLFVADLSAGPASLLAEPREFAPELNTRFHEGPLTFSRDGDRLFFTRNAYDGDGRHDSGEGVMKLNVYTSRRDSEGRWGEPRGLPWNTDDYEEAHPTLSADGRTLYFASDRPYGYGGMDLYRSRLEAGVWQAPENLGPRVNTAGNEAFPFVHADGTLYFASDGLGGVGGMDVFELARADTSVTPRNVGRPFNSRKDDFGFVLTEDRTRGYLASARRGGAGRDDIYSFAFPAPPVMPVLQRVCAHVAGDETRRLAGAEVTVTELDGGGRAAIGTAGGELSLRLRETDDAGEYRLALVRPERAPAPAPPTQTLVTGADGAVTVAMTPGRRYRVEVHHEGYATDAFEVTAAAKTTAAETTAANAATAQAPERCVGLRAAAAPTPAVAEVSGPSVTLRGVTENEHYGNVLPGVTLRLIDLCTGEERTTVSGADGSYSFGCVPCGCEFVIAGEKVHFAAAEVMAGTLGEECLAKPCARGGVVEAPVALMPARMVAGGPPAGGPAAGGPAAGGALRPVVLRAPDALGGAALAAGTIIELKDIYYDFDESYIRADARDDLDHLAAMMQRFPGMTIELGSHTDARATARYNDGLSQARAEAARDYLATRGVDGRRVTARGFGESRPMNRCRDFVPCSELEHQRNRRTEVRIVTVGDPGVGVRYVEAEPQTVDEAEAGRVFVWE